MGKRLRVYRVATETPQGFLWTCIWCYQTATTPAPTWDAAVDALMDEHTPECQPYQRWYAMHALQERRKARQRKRHQREETHGTLL